MIYATTLEAIDVDSGELLNGIAKEIKKKYKILRKKKKVWYPNTEVCRIHWTWYVIPKPQQLKLQL